MVAATQGGALRVVFLGTPQFAVPTLDALLRSRHAVVGVVTQPDRPRGRGQRTTDAPIKARALEAGIPVLQPDRLKDTEFLERLDALNADLGVVAAYGRILTEAVLALPALGLINVHASLLPKYRGAAPVHRAIVAGEVETGVTIMRVVKALDAGPMLATAARPIGPDETSEEVERNLARLGADLLASTVDRLAAGPVEEVPQDEARATYAHRLIKDDGIVNWRRTASELHNLVRGLYPWPHAFTFHDGDRLILLRSSVLDDTQSTEQPGTIVEATGDRLEIVTGKAVLRIEALQAEGGRPMTVREFLPGHRLRRGERFTAAP